MQQIRIQRRIRSPKILHKLPRLPTLCDFVMGSDRVQRRAYVLAAPSLHAGPGVCVGVAVPYAVYIGYESVVVAMGQKVGDILICDRKDSPRMGGDHFARVLLQQVLPGHPKIAYWIGTAGIQSILGLTVLEIRQ